ncbi:hypothetical protein CspeluHIS016_0406740 [Cutaneotrichosporon spelunceum]|uniref:Bacterial surface antigen (D15) domain-containing protein n=1 Tax=Cutaneotrichosporon spelunceum TaxID=1672016 RepID=A0AAD3TVU7_9TREE|nr:hypothetical protein CspeluHIS016_0406740 [Cutaneotrichosporon spelunceum]
MDANAQGGPPTAEVAEVDIDIELGTPPPSDKPAQVVESSESASASAYPEAEFAPSAAALFASARGERLKQAAERRIPEHREAPTEAEAEPVTPAPAAAEPAAPPEPAADISAPAAPIPEAPSDTSEEKPGKPKQTTKKKLKKTKEPKESKEPKAQADGPAAAGVPVEEVAPPPPPEPTLSAEDIARIEAQLQRDLAATPSQLDPPLAASVFRSASEPGSDRPVTEQDPAKVSAYQEDEFQRRLRGTYESAPPSIGDIVWGSMDRPMRVTSIRLSPPPPTTRRDFLDAMLRPFLQDTRPHWLYNTPPKGETLHEVLLGAKYMLAHIDQLGVFDMAHTALRLEPARSGRPDELELVLGLRERGRLFLKAGTEFGGNEGGGNVTARVRNALGGGEAIELNASVGTKTRSAYQLAMTVPVLASPYLSLQASAFSLDRDNTAFASHRELSQGARLKLAALTPWGNHDLVYEYVTREIGHLQPKASVSIRELAVPSTKASISHTWTSDTRDDPWCGTAGRLLKATHEYAGLAGSSEFAHFLKSTTQSQISRPIFKDSNVFVSVSSFTSLLYPLWKGEGGGKSYLPDRTFLGGPNSVRGFKVGGLGMSDKSDSLGGDLAYALGVSMIAPIPKKEQWPLKLHTFVNLGKVLRYDQTRNFADNIGKLYTCPSLSVGMGLLYRFDPLRIELNFSMPLIARKGERLGRGLSVGVGVEFL